jgi:predicted nucleotidyltransferase
MQSVDDQGIIMIYSIQQLKELVEPIAQKYKLKALWVFGSYARGESTEDSDVDFLMDYTDSVIVNFYDFVRIADELELILSRDVDLISTSALFSFRMKTLDPQFIKVVSKERLLLYEKH